MPKLPEHSPLGGSGAGRWMVCPGSVSLSAGVKDSASEYALEGTAAHQLADTCLELHHDAWEYVGGNLVINGGVDYEVSKDMADAVQTYLNALALAHPERNEETFFAERKFHCPEIHPLFFGQADVAFIDYHNKALHVWDYKHGAGIVIDVKENAQCMYYGTGMLEDLDLWHRVNTVVLHIAQPRGYHPNGPIRSWTISTEDLETWLDDELIPAMTRATTSTDTESGEHCRFCPARKMACPQLMADMDELEKLMATTVDKGGAKKLTNAQIGRFLVLFDTAKTVAKAAQETAFTRMSAGKTIPGRKLANSRTNREWKEGAEKAIKKEFGKKAYTDPELKSPAQIDGLAKGSDITARWAFKPVGKPTVVAVSDKRVAVNRDTKKLFKDERKSK